MAKGGYLIGDSNGTDWDDDEYTYVSVRERVRIFDEIVSPGVEKVAVSRTMPTTSSVEHALRHDPKVKSPSISLSSLSISPSIGCCGQCNTDRTSSEVICADVRDLTACPVRIFVGTWNCVYQDVEESLIVKPNSRDHYLSQRISRSVEVLSQWLTHIFHRFGQCQPEAVGHDTDDLLLGGNVLEPATSTSSTYCPPGVGVVMGCTANDAEHHCASSDSGLDEPCQKRLSRGLDGIRRESYSMIDNLSECSLVDSRDRIGADLTIALPNEVTGSPVNLSDLSPCKNVIKSRSSERVSPVRGFLQSGGDAASTISCSVSSADNKDGSVKYLRPPPTQERVRKSPLGRDDPVLTIRQSTLQLKPLTPEDKEPLHDWIPPGYDVYIIALQETLSSSLFTSITKYLQKHSSDIFERVNLEEYKISGYGDGAFLHMKSTSIAVWVRKSLLESGKMRIGKSKVIPLSVINRSKGVVTFQMYVLGQIIGVVGCHMPTRYSDREKAAAYIMKKLPEIYGANGSSVEDVFHHILWTGDFNFRVSNISAENALALLNNNLRDKLFSYDEFHRGRASTFAAMNFVEGPVRFFPTYKKRDDRDIVDRSSANWADLEYHTRYETQWYKGRNVKERVPSWTDRVLKWSVPALQTCLLIDDDSYRAAQPTVKNILLASDHSPVGCGFSIWPPLGVFKASHVLNLDTTNS